MRVAIHQPGYLPWVGFFSKVYQADVLVLLDTVEYSHGGYTNRVSLPDLWLTVPCRASSDSLISEVRIVPGRWTRKHKATLLQRYGEIARPVVNNLGLSEDLTTHNTLLIHTLLGQLGLQRRVVLASEIEIDTPESPSVRLLYLVQAVGGKTYLSGLGARKYLDTSPFLQAGIDVVAVVPPEASSHSILHEIGTRGVAATSDLLRTSEVLPWS